MIYGVKFFRNNMNGEHNTEETALISGLNEANALDILSKFCQYGIYKITYFRMIADGIDSDNNILILDNDWQSRAFS